MAQTQAPCRACGVDAPYSPPPAVPRCGACGSVNRVLQEVDGKGDAHGSLYFESGAPLEMTPPAVLRQYLDFLATLDTPDEYPILDFGCGTSDMPKLVRELGWTYVGVEPSSAARDILEAQGVTVADSLDNVARYAPFRSVVAIEVIEHLPDPIRILDEISALLVPEGKLFVTTPNADSLALLIRGKRWRQAANPTHLTLFSKQGLSTLMARAGYSNLQWMHDVDFGHSPVRARLQQTLASRHADGGLRVAAIRER